MFIAQVVAVVSPSSDGRAVDSDLAPSGKTADYSKEGSVIQTLRTAVTFNSDGRAIREGTARIQIQSEDGIDDWGQLGFGFNHAYQTVEIEYVRVLQPDGTTVTTPPPDIQRRTEEITSEYEQPKGKKRGQEPFLASHGSAWCFPTRTA